MLAAGRGGGSPLPDPAILAQRVWGRNFPNPIGIRRGVPTRMALFRKRCCASGFGFAEIGTVTPLPQRGNPKPRVFRLEGGRGADQPARVQQRRPSTGSLADGSARHDLGIVGVNIGRNRGQRRTLVADYEEGVRRTQVLADYLVVQRVYLAEHPLVGLPRSAGPRASSRTTCCRQLLEAPKRGPARTRAAASQDRPRICRPRNAADIAAVRAPATGHRRDRSVRQHPTVAGTPIGASATSTGGCGSSLGRGLIA